MKERPLLTRPGVSTVLDVVPLDEERKAAMVSNLLVGLRGERGTQPVVDTGG